MTLQEFRNDHKLLTNAEEIKTFCDEFIGKECFEDFSYPDHLHTYGACYWIDETENGIFFVDFANDHWEGDLASCEAYLYCCIVNGNECEKTPETEIHKWAFE